MSVTYRIDGNVVIIHPEGQHTTEDLRATWLAAEADPAFPQSIADVRICVIARDSASLSQRTAAELRETANWFAQRAASTSRIFAFVTCSGVQYGLARMMSAWIELKGYNAFVSTDPREAIEWLKAQKASAPPAS